MQLMHDFCNIFHYMKYDALKKIWDDACIKTDKRRRLSQMVIPILTRQWLVGKQACEIDEN